MRPLPDNSEKILINGLSLLKMLKHAKQGIPLEVMGIMLGQKIDAFTIEIFDVFSTPQVATGVNVETVDEKFQAAYMLLLERTGYDNLVSVGWYHSHPGYDVWLSNVDIQAQDMMEKLDPDGRAVAVVVDPVLSVRGKVVIGAFRNIPMGLMKGGEQRIEDPRPKTSFVGYTCNFRPRTIANGLNRKFYEMPIEFKMNKTELIMLSSLHKPNWAKGFDIPSFVKNDANCLEKLKAMTKCAKNYRNEILAEASMISREQAELAHVGKVDPKLFLRENSDQISNTQASLMSMLHITNQSF